MTRPAPARAPFRTSREVYDRIRWDARFDARRFTVVYEDRARGDVEVPFLDFVPGGDVPWHRVQCLREDGAVVWDRRSRIDRVFEARPAPTAATSWRDDPFFTPTPAWRWDAAAASWQPLDPRAAVAASPPRALSVVTYNVLSERHDPAATHPDARHPALLDRLFALDADVIVLQEVTAAFLARLADRDDVRSRYTLSDAPPAATLGAMGQLVVTRVPVTAVATHGFSQDKRVVVVELALGPRRVTLAAVHLSSDRAKDAPAARAAQLRALADHLPPRGDDACVIVGDFNARDDETHPAVADFVDAWPALHPNTAGFTFEPARNPLAALASLSGRPGRFDRVLVRDPVGALLPTRASLLGEEPVRDALHASDHWGLAVTLGRSLDARQQPPVYTSAVVVTPPTELWGPIQTIRARHDRHVDRWMPHVNLLYGFVPATVFEEALPVLIEALASVEPFTVTLDAFDRFEHPGSSTVWLRPRTSPPGALEALQRALQQAFPRCDEQGSKSGRGYTPHLTVAQFPREAAAEARAFIEQQTAAWTPVTFTVDGVDVIARDGAAPFTARHRVPFGRAPRRLEVTLHARGDLASDATRDARANALDVLQELAARVTGLPRAFAVCAIGSARLGLLREGGDLDAVGVVPSTMSRDAWFVAMRSALAAEGVLDAWRLVDHVVAPVASLTLAGVPVDLACARFPEGLPPRDPAGLPLAALTGFDRASRQSVEGVLDGDAVLTAVREAGVEATFRVVAATLKSWASARRLSTSAWGLASGITWTLLAAWQCLRARQSSAEDVVARGFEALAAWPWPQPIALRADARAVGGRDVFPVLTPCCDRDAARNVIPATRATLVDELVRARSIAARCVRGDAPWAALFEPPEVPPDAWRLAVTAPDDARLREAMGLLDGRALTLLLDLERDGATRLRPFAGWSIAGTTATFSLAVTGGQPAPAMAHFARTAQAHAAWPAGCALAVTRGPSPARESKNTV